MESVNIANWVPSAFIVAAIAIIGLIIKLSAWYGAVNNDRDRFKELMSEVRNDIKKILSRLAPVAVTANSPIILTDYGEKISSTVDAKAWAKAAKDNLANKVQGKEPFEVQEFAFDHANKFKPSDELLRKMSACAFENGTDLENVRKVMGVELRDVLLEHLNLKHSSLDVNVSASPPSR